MLWRANQMPIAAQELFPGSMGTMPTPISTGGPVRVQASGQVAQMAAGSVSIEGHPAAWLLAIVAVALILYVV